MVSERIYANVSLTIRLFILLLVAVSLILIMTAPGVCFWRTINGQQSSREICPPSGSLFPMNIDRWHSALHFQMRGQNCTQYEAAISAKSLLKDKKCNFSVWGQLAIIILSILVALPPVVLSCAYYTTSRNLIFSQIIAAAVAIVGFLIFGAVETWYATGFDHMATFIRQIGGGTFSGCAGMPGCETGFIVKGWAVAAAFYFLSAVLYILDVIIVFIKKNK